jgi:hypothetical protein
VPETKQAKRRKPAPEPDEQDVGPEHPGSEAEHLCNVAFCPIGLALSAVQPLKPDVVEHLLVAGREFFLAAKALLDARGEELRKAGVGSTIEKIDIG